MDAMTPAEPGTHPEGEASGVADWALPEFARPVGPPGRDTADDFALASRSTPLARVITDEIVAQGPITFARFMELALGHPEYGYYARPDLRWGAAGDFETSPEVHPIFGYLWARQIVECWGRLGRPRVFDLVEVGGGSGAFMASILTWIHERAPDCARAARPLLLDGHPARIEEQRRTLAAHGVAASHGSLDDWLGGTSPVTGVILSNELFDALPVHLVERHGETLHEWHVTARDGRLTLDLGAASTPDLAATFERLGVWPGESCRAEVSLAAPRLMKKLAAHLERGYLLTIDYGYEASALYASWRRMGTLLAFRHHSPQPDPLSLPGLTDLTAHVDFTSLTAAAEGAGCRSAPTVTQAEALVALGLGDALAAIHQRVTDDPYGYTAARRAAETLLEPHGLGRIRVLVQARDASIEGLRCLGPAASVEPGRLPGSAGVS